MAYVEFKLALKASQSTKIASEIWLNETIV